MLIQKDLVIKKGFPEPFGVSVKDNGFNFALFSKNALQVTLRLFDQLENPLEIPLNPKENKTGNVWHILVQGLNHHVYYSYRINGSNQTNPKNCFHQDLFMLDPYSKSVATTNNWGKSSEKPYQPAGEVFDLIPFDWEDDHPPQIPLQDSIIYEMHVRGFTQDPSSGVRHPGTFLGIIDKIPHLVDLGVTAIELLPVQEFNELEYALTHPNMKGKLLYNYWGYSTVNFFSPMNRYAFSTEAGAAITEFKTMVKILHTHGIEVILDIVLNHTAEGDQRGPVLSFKGIDNAIYYMLDEKAHYLNYSGCGNTFNCNCPVNREFILDVLRYWVTEMHVDGFRFDLASIFYRGTNGKFLAQAPLVESISEDPILANTKLIAEPWDAVGLYQVGSFYPQKKRWSEWNGKYRDSVRRFIKGVPQSSGEFAMRLCGSEDLYHVRSPCASINFVTAHDGFSLADLVSYNAKHNLDNGENNRDGNNANDSWNCGVEGPTTNPKILLLRERQMRNFHLALMVSQGVPMLLMGDEYAHSKGGNNNTWCHDSRINWFLWDQLKENQGFYRFYRLMIHFRLQHRILQRQTFLTPNDVDWHGLEPFKPDWTSKNPFIAFTLKDPINEHDLYIAFNAQEQPVSPQIPPPPPLKTWYWIVNTAHPSPEDFYESPQMISLNDKPCQMIAHSAVMLKSI